MEKLLFPYPSENLEEEWEKILRKDMIEKKVIELPFNSEKIVYLQTIMKKRMGTPENLEDAIEYSVSIYGYRVDQKGQPPKVRPIPFSRFDNRECKDVQRVVDQKVKHHIAKNYSNQEVLYNVPFHIEREIMLSSGLHLVPIIKE